MLFVFMGIDRPGQAEVRAEKRAAHRAYLSEVAGRVAFAGPLIGDDGKSVQGSLLVLEFPTREAAEAWLNQEPYTVAGVYDRIQISAFENRWPQRAGFPAAT